MLVCKETNIFTEWFSVYEDPCEQICLSVNTLQDKCLDFRKVWNVTNIAYMSDGICGVQEVCVSPSW